MPSAPHEILVMALREHPALLATLLERFANQTVPGPLAVVDSVVRFADVKEVRPDLVFTLPEKRWLVLEVQHKVDKVKRRRWPLVMSALLDEYHAMGDLVVLTPSRRVATWARRKVAWKGSLGSRLRVVPVVLEMSLETVETLLDQAATEPRLAFVAAWSLQRKRGPRAKAYVRRMLTLTAELPTQARAEQLRALFQLVSAPLAAYMQEFLMNLDALPENEAFQKLKHALEGDAQARGKLEGEREGKLEGERAALLRYLDRRGVALTVAQRATIEDCRDLATLERWLDAAFTARANDAIVKALFG